MKRYSEKIEVRYAETDQMGIAHHSCYPVWFEAARTGFIRSLGMSYTDFEKEGLLLPLAELNVKYKAYALYEDELTINVEIKRLTGARIVFAYEVVRANDDMIIATGETMHAFTNPDIKIINIKKTHEYIYKLLSS